MPLVLNSTKSFDRIIKKLQAKDKKVLDDAVKVIQENPSVGEEKRGDLVAVFVYKFKMNGQETLLAYELHPNKKKPTMVLLMAVGPHENFYAQLKRAK
jgi:mRNA-degrading endonuclease RelE of RelBE toxin-antitoxin system